MRAPLIEGMRPQLNARLLGQRLLETKRLRRLGIRLLSGLRPDGGAGAGVHGPA